MFKQTTSRCKNAVSRLPHIMQIQIHYVRLWLRSRARRVHVHPKLKPLLVTLAGMMLLTITGVLLLIIDLIALVAQWIKRPLQRGQCRMPSLVKKPL